MANKISVSLPGFLVGGFSQSHPRLLKMFLGLVLLPGCSLLQQPSDLAVPAETGGRRPDTPKPSVSRQPAPEPACAQHSRPRSQLPPRR